MEGSSENAALKYLTRRAAARHERAERWATAVAALVGLVLSMALVAWISAVALALHRMGW